MFLFLSKLLPLVLYPLGFACLLLVLALIFLWNRPRLAAWMIILALVVLLVGSNGWTTNGLVRSLEARAKVLDPLPNAEAIVVLGGCTRPAFSPRPAPDLTEAGDRVFYGAQLYRDGKAPRIILSGGRIDWRGSGPSESGDMAIILEQLGIPRDAILQDPNSLNTYQNAVNVKRILDELDIHRILLVTSAMHMPRSRLIFKKQGIDVIPAPTDFLVTAVDLAEPRSSRKAMLLNALPDAERLQKFSRALKEYYGLAIYWLRGWI